MFINFIDLYVNNYSISLGNEGKDAVQLLLQKAGIVDKDIFLPFYVAIIDSKDKLTNLEFYELNGEFNTQEDTENFIETELIKDISIKLTNSNDQITVILGFMLDNTKIELLN